MNRLRKFEDHLVWIAALIVLVGVSTAAQNVLAHENSGSSLEVEVNATTSELQASY